jgi:hypothetical protein
VVQEVLVHPIALEAAAEVIQEVHPHQEVLHALQVAPLQVEGDNGVETGHMPCPYLSIQLFVHYIIKNENYEKVTFIGNSNYMHFLCSGSICC